MSLRFTLFLIGTFLYSLTSAQVASRGVKELDNEQSVFTGKTYCIISGISRYQFIRSLDYADNDALAMRRFMMSESGAGLDSTDILMFLNENATAATLWIQSLQWIKQKNLQPGDRLLVYFSGHGDAVSPEEFYYLANDCDPGNDKDNYAIGGTIPLDKLKLRFKKFTNDGVSVVFIMDACRSNELPGGKSGITNLTEGILNKRTGELSILATGPGQVSIEGREFGGGHGLFTYVLLDGLYGYADKNKDGTITFRELEKYVKVRVEEEAEQKSVLQIPEFCCPDQYGLPLFKVHKEGLVAYEAEKKKRPNLKKEDDLVAMRGLPPKKTNDTTMLGLYTNFKAQLATGNLKGEGSADEILKIMESRLASEPLIEKAKTELAIALLDAVQETINTSIRGDEYINAAIFPNRVLNMEIGAVDAWALDSKGDSASEKKFETGDWAVNKVLELLEEDFLPRQFKTRQLFLKVMSQKPGPEKDSTMIQLVRDTYASDSGSAFFYHTIGIWQSKKGETDSAMNLFKQAEIEAPNSATYKTSSGLMLWRNGDITGAKKKFEEALAIQPKNEHTRFLLATFYYRTGEKEKATALLDYSFESKKIQELAAFQKAVNYHNNGQLELARNYFKKAISLNPKNPDYFFYLALAYDQDKMIPEAEHYYLWSIKLDPNYLESHNNLAALYLEVDDLDLAFVHLDIAFKQDPENYKTLNNMGMYFIKQSKFDSAEKFLLESYKLAPDNDNNRIIKNLVTLYYLQKDNLKAEYWFKKLK